MKIVLSTQYWPVVLVTFPPACTEVALHEHLLECEGLLRREQLFFCIRDMSRIKQVPGATLRRAGATWEHANREALGRLVIGLANVNESTLVRGAITAIRWISAPPFPETTVSTLEEAHRWGEARYRERGLPVPEAFEISGSKARRSRP